MDWTGFALRCRGASQPGDDLHIPDSSEHISAEFEHKKVVSTPPYQLILQGVHDPEGSHFADMEVTPPTFSVMSLQQWCRRSVLKALTIERIDKIRELPLPPPMKAFLATFGVPEDFDTEGFHMNYNFHFPNHPHHRTHRVHPAQCLFDSSRVLIKAQNMGNQDCNICFMLGERLMFEQESDRWASVNHPHLQRCYMKMVDEVHKITCYVLEFPLISLKDLAIKLSFASVYVPEVLIWDTLYKVSSALLYLQKENLHNELYEPQHFILDQQGEVKVENLLLYLPTQGSARYRTSAQHRNAIYTAPEQWVGNGVEAKSSVWGLGCVIYELVTLSPAFLLETYSMKVVLPPLAPSMPVGTGHQTVRLLPRAPPPLPPQYSQDLSSVINNCLRESVHQRPDFTQLIDTSHLKLQQLRPLYTGPKTLLELLPDVNSLLDD